MQRFDPSSYQELRAARTDIPGLLVVALAVHGDSRGWFKENYHQEKMSTLGFPPDFTVAQNNITYHALRGVTRGIHADPWDKYISLAAGSIFSAIVDLRAGDTYGKVLTFELNPGIALFVPRGCGNAYQTLEDGTVYTYFVNKYWTPETKTVTVSMADPDLRISWPVPLEMAQISDEDKSNPSFKDIQPISS